MTTGLALACLVLLAGPDFGPAPPETVKPVESVNRLLDLFGDCAFTATQKSESSPPSGLSSSETVTMECKVCSDAIVIHSRARRQYMMMEGGKFRQIKETDDQERKWEKGDAFQQIMLAPNAAKQWPVDTKQGGGTQHVDGVKVKRILGYPDHSRNRHAVWGGILCSNFVGTPMSHVPLTDMVSGDNPFGYSLTQVTWATEDHASIRYQFVSPDYGVSFFTFGKVNGEWMPTQIVLVKEATNKLGPSTPDRYRLNNDGPVPDFKPPSPGLDRLETNLEIAYSGLPKSIRSTVTRTYKNENSVLSSTLTFDNLRCGDVTCEEVRAAMLPIADGTKIMLASADAKNIQWVSKGGKIAKSSDLDAIGVGRFVLFSSQRQLGIVVTSVIVAILAAMVLFRRLIVARRAT